MDRVILHSDLNNFYASVEGLDNEAFRINPMAVSGNPEMRHGIILAKNNIAKSFGVKTGDTIWQAETKCRNILLCRPHFEKYAHYSKVVRQIYYTFTDRIETFGLDECWLDVTGSQKLFGDGETIANSIKEKIKLETGLTVSIGVSFTKVFSKLGSDMKKPDAVTVITRENYKEKVWTVPVGEMLNIGKKTQVKLRNLNISTIGDLAKCSEKLLNSHFGIIGSRMKKDAMGIEEGEVLIFDKRTPIKSVGNGITTRRDMTTNDDVRSVIFFLAEEVASRLRQYGFCCTGVAISIRDTALSTISRQHVLSFPSNSEKTIAKEAYECFLKNYNLQYQIPIRSLTVQAYNLVSEGFNFQQSLFDIEIENFKEDKLGKSLDVIRDKFGFESVTKASFINNDLIASSHKSDDVLPFQRNNK